MRKTKFGFSLIEVLVVVSIIGVLMGLTLLGLQGSRQSSRDAKRKSDLELLRTGFEVYKTDCKTYPTSNVLLNQASLKGSNAPGCPNTNVYITQIPKDPGFPAKTYRYYSDGVTYEICTSLEKGGTPVSCGPYAANSCGVQGDCNYKVTNP